jgi:hypothetical protein
MTRISTTGPGSSAWQEQYQITSTTKDIWDRDTAVTFNTSTGAIAASDVYAKDYLFGTVQFASTYGSKTLTMAGKYLPRSAVVGANEYSFAMSANMIDDTDFTSTGFRSRFPGIRDASVSLGRYDSLQNDIFAKLKAEESVVIDLRPGGSTNFAVRGFFHIASDARTGAVEDLESASPEFELDGDSGQGSGRTIAFGTPR